MKVIVTGSAGFIGSHTVRRLVGEGHYVVGIDDFNNFYDPKIKKKNVAEFLKNKNFKLEKCDIRDMEKISKIFKKYKPTHVVHLAARAGVRPSIEDPVLYYDVNVGGTLNILAAAQNIKVKNFVFASSSSVYGGCENIPFEESEWPLMPISPYAATKLAGENLCYFYHKQFGMNVTCLRFFTVYGPSGRPDMAPYLFTDTISKGKPIKKFGDGTTKRDYTYVEDIVEGIVSSVKKPMGYEIINLGNNNPITLNEFISIIEHALGKRAKIEKMPEQKGDVSITYADINKAKKLLGFKPKVKMEQGMEIFIKWYLSKNKT
ncbi:MAG: hypothetical protein ACD_51C00316G0013 [uncultured bacterium]|nr:MAG: hypothetical protein ACD_51C00316G0013 [uncultured bacterium]OGJ47076.1 MAG: epimerase [Candidatus Peregrinibacteria bacterium RIFOXYA2_FULL_41_18]OGJ49764.1 MAG: epimerase [Candidatus Peregrinibacteria bacterium RIFOXYB12_FULL_41_12]OGJ52653.1 MAG: epimerase [Candidatus Peregrinibacteria bacterium RIFOXYC2_FULL_41_22]OGJ54020.1 MAG: epimerase [Candidatus Peregrinibacteria bacterium RIFOXYB2_FULL_41_88]